VAASAGQSFSVGIAEWDGVEDLDALMANADARLYRAKAAEGDFVITAN
jgi:PleD family two-component response regulator